MYMEVGAFHPRYRPGRDHRSWNQQHNSWPQTRYVKSEDDFLDFVRRWSPDRLVCCGLNPRPRIYQNRWGYARPAREGEVDLSHALLVDLDPVEDAHPDSAALERCLGRAEEFFQDLGLALPGHGYSGRGLHLLARYEPIPVRDYPDMKPRVALFSQDLQAGLDDLLESVGLQLDSSPGLRRLVKVYGTAKPGGTLSRLGQSLPAEDPRLREYLLGLQPQPADSAARPNREGKRRPVAEIHPTGNLPDWFLQSMIEPRIRALWEGRGKPGGTDRSRSGYDFSLLRELIRRGHDDPGELATILALRPEGAVRRSGKGAQYLAQTVRNARLSQ